jgi:uncharacterized membrane protein
MFLPVMFLPFFSGRALVLLIPGLLQNLLTGNEFQFSGVFQYDGILIAAVFVCSIWGLQYLLDHWPGREKIWQWTLLAAVLIGFMLRSPVKPINFPVELFGENPRWEAFREMIALVPDDAAVAAQTNIVPHLSHREHAHMLGREPMAVDMVLVDAQDSFGFPDTESFQRYIDSYLDSGLYSVIYARDERFAVIVRNGLLEQ